MQKWVFCVRGVNFAKISVHSVREWRTPCSKTSVKHRGHFRILKEGTSKNHTFGGPGWEAPLVSGCLQRNLPRGGRAVSLKDSLAGSLKDYNLNLKGLKTKGLKA